MQQRYLLISRPARVKKTGMPYFFKGSKIHQTADRYGIPQGVTSFLNSICEKSRR